MHKSANRVLISLQQQDLNGIDDYLGDVSESNLRMDDFMKMKLRQKIEDSPMCTANCVSRCGSLAELPRTEASQLVGCFEETCGCTSKWSDVGGNQDRTEA